MKMKWHGARAPKPGPVRGPVSTRARVLRGGTYGRANKGRRLSEDERRLVEDQLRRTGQLGTVP
jgi:hypothetical protein